MLQKTDQFIQKSSKILGYVLGQTLLVIVLSVIYMVGFYPQRIANQTKLGMTKLEVEQNYAGKKYRYQDNLPVCTIGCDNNILLPKHPKLDEPNGRMDRYRRYFYHWL